MDGKREGKHSSKKPKISMAYHNKHIFLAHRSPGWLQSYWALLGSVGLPVSSHSVFQDEEARLSLSKASYMQENRSSRDKPNSWYFLKPLLKTGHCHFHLRCVGEGKPKVKAAGRRVHSAH